jgi:ABC-type enterochelin transport system substrate-binding protein
MKRIIFIAALTVLLLLSACTSEQSVYEKAIADYVQTDRRGTWTDCKFKTLSIEKTADVTVADSLKTLQAEFEKSRDEQIASQQRTLDYFNGLLKDNQSAKYAKQAVPDQLNQSIATTQARIDSLHNLPVAYADRYKGRNPADVLAVEVKCH